MLVRHDQDLHRPREQVDAHLAEQLPLGLGDERVARARQEVDLGDRLSAEGHGREGLDAAQEVDLVRAGGVHRRDGGIGDAAGDGRRAGNDVFDAGHFGRQDRHVRAGQEGISAAGDVPDEVSRISRHSTTAELTPPRDSQEDSSAPETRPTASPSQSPSATHAALRRTDGHWPAPP